MWIFQSDSFLSIVAPAQSDLPPPLRPKWQDYLIVRARKRGDIERVFKGVRVVKLPNRDYAFRAYVPRDRVAGVMFDRFMNIEYGNFKGSVKDDERHDAYMSVWSVMNRYQLGQFAPAERKLAAKSFDFDWR
ncbi:hypothetical protein UFOVP119_24 [uncultured Caudovirales phage]|uniref:Uncharacterized protein n=1 Tax=uncultured Caudovirales phage TaxID=2100421 RepID=A0A6J5LBV2_9CAUD|nr:hypothetical protein UFOVP119_24 [uncultured Caudovirales phage]